MSLDELKYVAVLAGSIPVGFLMKRTGTLVREVGAMLVGVAMVLATCGFHVVHSLLTILVTWAIIRFSTKYCHSLTLLWTFSYLLFFRMQGLLHLPIPTPFANAVQLLLTLKMVSLAAELNQLYLDARPKETSNSDTTTRMLLASLMPGLKEMLCYSYCYLGIMTGPFYRYKTYQDWVYESYLSKVPSWKPMLRRMRLGPLYGVAFLLVSHLCPLDYVRTREFADSGFLYHVFYTSLTFFIFRMRFYVAWTFAECACMAAGFGAYPVSAQSRSGNGPTHQYYTGGSEKQEYDYETVRNIDPYNTDFCTSVKDGMKYWNMTVQWWLAHYIYRSAPVKPRILRIGWTMLVSAFWHGIHPGYYLSFLTIPLCLAAEGAMDSGVRERLGERGRGVYDWLHWFCKMRAYDYMCMGFVLLSFWDTLLFWQTLYFYIHGLALGLFVLGYSLALLRGKETGLSRGLFASSKDRATPPPQPQPQPRPLPQHLRAPVMRLPSLPPEVRRRLAPRSEQGSLASRASLPLSPPSPVPPSPPSPSHPARRWSLGMQRKSSKP